MVLISFAAVLVGIVRIIVPKWRKHVWLWFVSALLLFVFASAVGVHIN